MYRGLPRELQTLCKNKAVKAAVLASMRAEGKAAKLNSFEQVGQLPVMSHRLSLSVPVVPSPAACSSGSSMTGSMTGRSSV